MTGFVIFILVAILIGTVVYVIYRASQDISKSVENKNKKEEFQNKVARLTPQYEKMYEEYVENAEEEIADFIEQNTKEAFLVCESKETDAYVALSKDEKSLVLIDAILPKKHEVSYRPESVFGTYIVGPKPLEIKTKEWEISNILYFKMDGNLQYTTNVSGGGVNVGGAIAGAVIAGGAGAIIGSRNAVSTETVEHDSREFIVAFADGNEFCISENSLKYYNAFMKLIPQKEISVYMQSVISDSSSEKIDSNELMKLKELLDSGIITQEEFDAKKKQILGL